MKTLFLSLLLLSTNAFADVGPFSSAPEMSRVVPLTSHVLKRTRFDELAWWYDQAAMPSAEEFIGWKAGRCYNASQPDSALPGLIIGYWKEEQYRTMELPQLPEGQRLMSYVVISCPDCSPDIFDNMNEETRQKVREVLDTYKAGAVEAKSADGGITSSHNATLWNTRSTMNHLVTAVDHYMDDSTDAFCEFWLPVH